MNEQDQEKTVPTWGLLAINHVYNEGNLTFKEWMRLSREWAEAIIRQYGTEEKHSEQEESEGEAWK